MIPPDNGEKSARPRHRKPAAAAFLSVLLLLAAPHHAAAATQQTVDRILVIVNDEIITESDLATVLQPVVTRLRASMGGRDLYEKVEEARIYYLRQLVDDRLIISAAKLMDIEIEESEVDEMMSDMRKKFPNQEAFEALLREQGLSVRRLRERFRDDILKRKAIDFKVRSRVAVSPGEIKKYYTDHEEEFRGSPELKIRQILIRTGVTRSEETAEATAEFIAKKLDEGADIAALAREYSEGVEAADGGDMGWIKQGQFMERIDDVLMGLEPGKHSGPIKTQLGFHIFKIEDKTNTEPIQFEDVRGKIANRLYGERTKELLTEWLDELRKDAYIEHKG